MDKIRYLVLMNFIICVVLSGVAFYYNAVEGVPLCPLCSMQLLCYYLIGIVSLVRFVYLPELFGRYLYGIFLIVFSAIGAFFASREVWIQHLVNKASLPCPPDVLESLEKSNLTNAMHNLFTLYNNCALTDWQFLGLSMPSWSLVFFAVLVLSALALLAFAKNEREVDA